MSFTKSCVEKISQVEPQQLATSAMAKTLDTVSIPAPPYSSEIFNPITPISASSLMDSAGYLPVLSISSARDFKTFCA